MITAATILKVIDHGLNWIVLCSGIGPDITFLRFFIILTHRCGVELEPLANALKQVVLQQRVIHADETPVTIMVFQERFSMLT
jgi:hypothetical protein